MGAAETRTGLDEARFRLLRNMFAEGEQLSAPASPYYLKMVVAAADKVGLRKRVEVCDVIKEP